MDDEGAPDPAEEDRADDGFVPLTDLPAKVQVLLASRWSWRRRRGMRLSSRWVSEHGIPRHQG